MKCLFLISCFTVLINFNSGSPATTYIQNNKDAYNFVQDYSKIQYIPSTQPGYQNIEYVPEIRNGVPVDTPEVEAAKAQHFAAYSKVLVQSLPKQRIASVPVSTHVQRLNQIQPSVHSFNGYVNQINDGNSQQVHDIKNGVPIDTPEVEAAKAQHFAAYAKALARASQKTSSGNKYSQYSVNEIGNDFAAPGHLNSQLQARPVSYQPTTQHYRHTRGISSGSNSFIYQQHIPIITKAGVPEETPEVKQAKAQHFLAHAKARAQSNYGSEHSGPISTYSTGQINHEASGHQNYGGIGQVSSGGFGHSNYEVFEPQNYEDAGHLSSGETGHSNYGAASEQSVVKIAINHEGYSSGYNGGHNQIYSEQYIPIIDKHGVPQDTPEVQAAKQQHFLAHARAQSGQLSSEHFGIGSNFGSAHGFGSSLAFGAAQGHGVVPVAPVDTPEVQLEKARHFAAHQAERARHAKLAAKQSTIGKYSSSVYHY